jgi:nucleoside-diphosphate-sugar epimerase
LRHLVCFGFGFSAKALSAALLAESWTVSATSRTEYGLSEISSAGAKPIRFGSEIDFRTIDCVLISAPPGEAGDPVLAHYQDALAANAKTIRWTGYLSTTGVYGDRDGAWVDETSPLTPNTERGRRRLSAETAWLELFHKHGLPVHIFRLAGIYGPGRNQLLSVLDGTAKRIVKPGQIFSRIHVEDISGILEASIAKPDPGAAYNVCDDEPCPPQEAVAFAAELLGKPLPPEIPFEQADLSPMARSFYADSKRVSNRKVKDALGYRFRYPTYREGLTALARPFLEGQT